MRKLLNISLIGEHGKIIVWIALKTDGISIDNEDFSFIGNLITKHIDYVQYGLIDEIELKG
ncbi:MAG: hypothetical protein EHM34_06865 [Nitrosopumilales archaeon]|nr:MAG: hypothetical protein EHM34_06865 [Nitrosopumilales archaeon]